MRQHATMKVAGYLSRDPELRYTPQGDAVLGLSVPFTPRKMNKQTNQWEDAGPTLWVQASLWREQAELFADKLAKGTAVIVEGVPSLRSWESNGKSGVNLELRFAQVSIVPTAPRRDAGHAPQAEQWAAPSNDADAWAAPGVFDDQPF